MASFSAQHRKNLSLAHIGKVAWNKGNRFRRMLICLQCRGEFVTKQAKPHQKYCSKACSAVGSRKLVNFGGANNPNWKGGVSNKSHMERVRFREKLQKLIFERDGYKCQICLATGDLQIDHIKPWSQYEELRFDPDNCRTLCTRCHYRLTFRKEMPASLKAWGHNLLKGGASS